MKVFCIVLDGAADRKIAVLKNRTPLEAAETRFLDEMTSKGQMSLISVLSENLSPESDSGAMALLGYSPEHYYCGRGTLECMGLETYRNYRYFSGFRINFASVDSKKGTLERRTARELSDGELQELTQEIVSGVSLNSWGDIHFELKTFGHFRGILGLYSNTHILSGNVTNTDPGYVKQGRYSVPVADYPSTPLECRPLDTDSEVTAGIVNDFVNQCSRILNWSKVNFRRSKKGQMPANCILVRDGGSVPQAMPSFNSRYGASLSIYGQLPCEKAIADLIGGKFYYTQGIEFQADKEYLRKLAQTLKHDTSNVIFCHLKGPDEPGHDNKPFDKVKAIEMIDEYFFSQLWDPQSSCVYVVSCDHATPCELGIHSADRVPLLIVGNSVEADSTNHFDEINAFHGNCIVRQADEIMPFLFNVREEILSD